jgi:hypothetical protein
LIVGSHPPPVWAELFPTEKDAARLKILLLSVECLLLNCHSVEIKSDTASRNRRRGRHSLKIRKSKKKRQIKRKKRRGRSNEAECIIR